MSSRFLSAAALIFVLLVRVACAAEVAPSVVPGAVVRTLAGDGVAGIRDGRGTQAEFLFPQGLAYDPQSGVLYIADSAAQRIRRLGADGVVGTLAGFGSLLPSGLAVEGGYVDGPAEKARFNRPSGVALGADGSVYVADARNHCIRRISGGIVRTFAGNARQAGFRDGALSLATFQEPRSLAFGADGTLYVADYGVGVRVIKGGNVTTLSKISPPFAQTVTKIAVWQRFLFLTSQAGVLRYNLADDGMLNAAPPRAYYALLPVSDSRYIASQPRSNAIAFSTFAYRRLISGYGDDDGSESGGFADGLPENARFFAPMDLVFDGQGNIVVADAGNRRIRVIPRIDVRWGGDGPPAFDPKVYHIALISNSMAFHNSMWADSIEGTIERRLNAEGAAFGLTKTVTVQAIEYGSRLKGHADYIQQVLGQGSVELVIWSLNTHMFFSDTVPGAFFGGPDFSSTNEAYWRELIRKTYKSLREAGTKLVLTDHAHGYQLSLAEASFWRDFTPPPEGSLQAHPEYRFLLRQPDFGYERNVSMERFLASAGVDDYFPTWQRFVEFERGAHGPLSPADDPHYDPRGNVFYGNLLADYLEKVRPWKQQAR